MGVPVVEVTSGGLGVTESTNGLGLPVDIATNGIGSPVRYVDAGGLPVVSSGRQRTLVLPVGATAIYSLVRTPGYSGQCLRVVRTSDSVESDIGFTASGTVDVVAATTFQGGSTLTLSKWYDQSGNANHATQTVAGSQPRFSSLAKYVGQQLLSFGNIDEVFAGTKRYFDLPAGLSFNRRDNTVVAMIAPGASGNLHSLWALGSDATTRLALINSNTPLPIALDGGSILTLSPAAVPALSGPTFMALRSNATAVTVFNGGKTANVSTVAAAVGTATGGMIGYSFGGSSACRGDILGLAIYSTALSDGAVAQAKAGFEAAWPLAAGTKSRLLMVGGNSITESYGATYHLGRTRQTLNTIGSTDIDYYNMAISGATAATLYGGRVASISKQYSASYAYKAFVLKAGINDVKAATTGANIWANSISPYAQYAIGLGYDVAIGTLIKCPSLTGGQETERLAFNAAAVAGAAGIGARLIDYAADDASMTFFDTTHPDNAGYALMSARELPTIRTMLGL